jgi:hypothetical protein
MKHSLISMAVAAACLTAPAFAMTNNEMKVEKERIAATYKSATDACKQMSGNAKDICVSEAKGNEKIAKADLDAQDKPSAKARHNALVVRADAAYATAKEKCDEFAGNSKDVCRKDAQAAHERALADAKAELKTADATNTANAKIADARNDADKDKREADFKAARERCDSLAGDAKDRCVADAKVRYGMK